MVRSTQRRGIGFRGLLGDRANLAFGGGIVHRDIETAKPRDGLVDQTANVVFLAHVGVDELGLRAERAQLLSERAAGSVTPPGNDHLRALLREGDSSGAADPGQRSGDQNDGLLHVFSSC
ncbi:MAG: hypothetical protein QOC66_1623 [Pseudonocardiales bacterium]|nr:hypothetical protein [Pseudonocardiales bacterium]